MKQILVILSVTGILISCSTTKTSIEKAPEASIRTSSPLEEDYYMVFNGNQARLHQLMLGTFVAYDKKGEAELESWTVTETDSVVLYSVPIGDITKQGYWVYSYEFMTSLPNNPIYTTIKEIVQKDRDTFEIHYYKPPAKYTLIDILEKNVLAELDFKSLEKTTKITTFHKVTNTNFVGFSARYEDKNLRCLRQNKYDASPQCYKVDASFFSLKDNKPINKRNRPNIMMRRLIDKELLLKIANKEFEEDGD